nr:LOW QUALITY PROTEIN: galactose-3-O-sulfotransferase 2-like [Lytechinus pictus]
MAMMRIGKRVLLKFGAFSITLLLIVLASLSLLSPKRARVTDHNNAAKLRIDPVASGVKSPSRHGARNGPRRYAQGLGPNKYISSNVSWVHKSLLGKSKHNITLDFMPKTSNRTRGNASIWTREETGKKVLKRQEDIRRVRHQLEEKKQRRKEEIVKLTSKASRHGDGSCHPQGNVAYIKTHKTASTTLQTVINRYGLLNKLSFVMNKVSPTNGHFVYIPVTKHSPRYFFLPPLGVAANDFSHFKYNMIAVHLRYNRSAMDFFMLPETKYITIIREPSAHFESAFNHFRFTDSFSPATRCRVKGHEIEEFMRRPGYYRRRLKTLPWDTTRGLRWYYARNNQIFDLGLDSKYHADETMVNRTVDNLVKELDLVLISEYFDESLVLLKKMLCWSFDDIVYISKNQRPSRVDINQTTRQSIREWSRADTILYERFNATLWKKIKDYGPEFLRDLATFRKRKEDVFRECAGENTYVRMASLSILSFVLAKIPLSSAPLWLRARLDCFIAFGCDRPGCGTRDSERPGLEPMPKPRLPRLRKPWR